RPDRPRATRRTRPSPDRDSVAAPAATARRPRPRGPGPSPARPARPASARTPRPAYIHVRPRPPRAPGPRPPAPVRPEPAHAGPPASARVPRPCPTAGRGPRPAGALGGWSYQHDPVSGVRPVPLRVRLAIAFTAILLVPTILLGVLVWRGIAGARSQENATVLMQQATSAVRGQMLAECERLAAAAQALAVTAAVHHQLDAVTPLGASGVWAL